MTKQGLIDVLNNESDLTKLEVAAVGNLFFVEMTNALTKGDRVEIRGLCTIYVKKYKAYTGRNPRTEERVRIKPEKLTFFRCGKELKDRVNHKWN